MDPIKELKRVLKTVDDCRVHMGGVSNNLADALVSDCHDIAEGIYPTNVDLYATRVGIDNNYQSDAAFI